MNQKKSLVHVVNNPARDGVVRMTAPDFEMTFGLTKTGKILKISVTRPGCYFLDDQRDMFIPREIYNQAARMTFAILRKRKT